MVAFSTNILSLTGQRRAAQSTVILRWSRHNRPTIFPLSAPLVARVCSLCCALIPLSDKRIRARCLWDFNATKGARHSRHDRLTVPLLSASIVPLRGAVLFGRTGSFVDRTGTPGSKAACSGSQAADEPHLITHLCVKTGRSNVLT